MTPIEAANLLDGLNLADALNESLAEQAGRLAQLIRDSLSGTSGDLHNQPWLETGSLRDSISVQAEGLTADVGSNDPAAAPQELGTRTTPPRPFLAPAAAQAGEAIAFEIGRTVFELMAKQLR